MQNSPVSQETVFCCQKGEKSMNSSMLIIYASTVIITLMLIYGANGGNKR